MFFCALHDGAFWSAKKSQRKHEKSECHNQVCPTILEALSFHMGKTWYVLEILG